MSTVTTSCPGGNVLGVSTPAGYAYWGYSGSIAGFVAPRGGADLPDQLRPDLELSAVPELLLASPV